MTKMKNTKLKSPFEVKDLQMLHIIQDYADVVPSAIIFDNLI